MGRKQTEPSLVPWRLANYLYYTEPPAGSVVLGKLGFWRSLLGLVTIILVSLPARGAWDAVNEEGWATPAKNVSFLVVAAPVAVLGIVLLTRKQYRRDFSWGPLIRRLALLLVTSFGPMSLLFIQPGGEMLAIHAMEAVPPLAILILAFYVWFAFYLLAMTFWALRSTCWLGDFHPLLGPTLTAVMATTFTVAGLLGEDTGGLPRDVWLRLTFIGLGTTLVLALVEYVLLRRRRRIGWRTGPEPHRDGVHEAGLTVRRAARH